MNLEPVRSMQNIEAVRKVFDSVETHVRRLKHLGIDSKQYGYLLVPILIDKLSEVRCLSVENTTTTSS